MHILSDSKVSRRPRSVKESFLKVKVKTCEKAIQKLIVEFLSKIIAPRRAAVARGSGTGPNLRNAATNTAHHGVVARLVGVPLESVSLCTRFSGFSTIFSFGFNRLGSKLVGLFFGIVLMFVLKDFVQDCFVAQIRAKMCVRAGIRAYLRDEAIRNKILGYEHWNYPKEHAYQF